MFPGQILLELNDANTVFRDKLIGSFTLDAGFVYRSPAHFVSAWVALVSPTAAVIQGYLKVRHRCCAWVPRCARCRNAMFCVSAGGPAWVLGCLCRLPCD